MCIILLIWLDPWIHLVETIEMNIWFKVFGQMIVIDFFKMLYVSVSQCTSVICQITVFRCMMHQIGEICFLWVYVVLSELGAWENKVIIEDRLCQNLDINILTWDFCENMLNHTSQKIFFAKNNFSLRCFCWVSEGSSGTIHIEARTTT